MRFRQDLLTLALSTTQITSSRDFLLYIAQDLPLSALGKFLHCVRSHRRCYSFHGVLHFLCPEKGNEFLKYLEFIRLEGNIQAFSSAILDYVILTASPIIVTFLLEHWTFHLIQDQDDIFQILLRRHHCDTSSMANCDNGEAMKSSLAT